MKLEQKISVCEKCPFYLCRHGRHNCTYVVCTDDLKQINSCPISKWDSE